MNNHEQIPEHKQDIEAVEREIGEFFDRCSEEGLMVSFAPDEKIKIEQSLARWNIRPEERVLEPGCGAGRLTERLARAVGENGLLYACDLSPGMIELARARELPPQARVDVGSVNNLPFEDGYFHAAVCLHAFPHFPDLPRALAEMSRVLRPGGQLWIEHLKGRNHINQFHRNSSPVISHHLIPPEDEMRDMLGQAGFTVSRFVDDDELYSVCAVKAAVGQ